MSRRSNEPVRELTADQFVDAARSWTRGDPFPVIAGPPFERTKQAYGERLVAVDIGIRPGVVLSTGSPATEAAAGLLARATSRPHEHLPAEELPARLRLVGDREHVALVATVADARALPDWPAAPGARFGLITARSTAALTALIYRTLTPRAAHDGSTFVSSHPLWDGAEDADVVEIAGLEILRKRRPALLVLRGQGRECANSVLDGMVCGRVVPLPDPLPAPPPEEHQRSTPCQLGEGCFRTDVSAAELIPAYELNSVLTMLHSCNAIAVNTNAYTSDISVSLSFLDGSTTAVIGTLGVHVAQASSTGILAEALKNGRTLGEAVHAMNTETGPLTGGLARFGLLGDPALRMPMDDIHPALATAVPAASATDLRQRLALLDSGVLPRLERLRWFGMDVPATATLRAGVVDAAQAPAGSSAIQRVEAVELDAARFQDDILERLADFTYTHGWQYAGDGYTSLREVNATPATCPSCRTARADVLELAHRIDPALQVSTLQCRRCGDVWWSNAPITTQNKPELLLDGPVDISAGKGPDVVITRTLHNHSDRQVSGSWAAVFRSRKHHGLPAPHRATVTVGPRSSVELVARFDLSDPRIRHDTHTLPVLAIVDGAYLASMVMLDLR